MAKRAERVPWLKAYALMAGGMSMEEAAKRVGTTRGALAVQSCKRGWTPILAEIRKHRGGDLSGPIADEILRHRQRMYSLVNKGLTVLEEQEPTPASLEDYSSNLDKLDKITRRQLGMDKEEKVDPHMRSLGIFINLQSSPPPKSPPVQAVGEILPLPYPIDQREEIESKERVTEPEERESVEIEIPKRPRIKIKRVK